MYDYNAKIVRVIDGDTVVLNVDLGFRLWREDSFRLAQINAPEMKGETYEAGLAAKQALEAFLPVGKEFYISTLKSPDKYGRYLVTIFFSDVEGNPNFLTVNKAMINTGHAVPYLR